MSENFINILEEDICNAEIGLKKKSSQNEEKQKGDKQIMTFNGFNEKAAYITYYKALNDIIEDGIEKELKASVSRNKALYYIKQLKSDFSRYKKSFSEHKAYDLTDEELLLYQHRKNAKQKLPEEFIGIKKRKYLRNINISYPPNFVYDSKNIKTNFLNKFEDSFSSIQLVMLEEIIKRVDKYKIFIESLSDEEFNSNYEFFEHKHPVLTLSETVKLTDKEVDIKIDTFDKRQTALFFHYLERAKLILEYTITEKANFAYYLTGHGKRKLQQLMGETSIRMLKLDINKPNDETSFKYENLNVLKEQLNNIIKIIDDDIVKMEEG